jgi:hypothetical protein
VKRVVMIAIALTACGDNEAPRSNAPVLWLALDGRETDVRLVEEEPDPY